MNLPIRTCLLSLLFPAPALFAAEVPDLGLVRAGVFERTVTPGEALPVGVVVENRGDVDARNVRVRVASSSGWSRDLVLERIAAGEQVTARVTLLADEAARMASPHFLTVAVDPDGEIDELTEENNAMALRKPVFVVNLDYRLPELVEEHDDVFVLFEGRPATHTTTRYGAEGGTSFVEPFIDVEKVQPGFEVGLDIDGIPALRQPRVDSRLLVAEAEAQPGDLLQFLVVYEHDVPMPSLPGLPDNTARFSPTNLQVLQQRAATFEAVRRMRREAATDIAREVELAGGQVREYHTLAGAMLVEVPAGQLTRIEAISQVRHLEVIEGGELPPDTVRDGRNRIQSDPYYNGGATGSGYIALLDSGVRTSHTLFTSPDHILIWEDCVYGNSYCSDTGHASYNADDNCWDHGTSTAAIITGNSDLGNNSRGVTGSWLDSWKVYGGCNGLNTNAVLRGYDEAVRWGDQIVVAEMQSGQSDSGSISTAADNAFDAGSITIAANGNNGPNSGTVNAPAIAHKALGIGAYDVDSLAHQNYQSEGPTPDYRYKPDIQAPTNADTASTASSTTINNFGGTSGATPFAAGAASVFADWFNLTARTRANGGKIYASLINGGPRAWGSFNNVYGTGRFELPLGGKFYTGSRNVSHHENEVISFNVPSSATQVRATLWWAESQSASHADIDLYVRDHYNITRDSSTSGPSVFEHAIANNPYYTGTWDLRVYGYNVPSTVTVYYAIHVVY